MGTRDDTSRRPSSSSSFEMLEMLDGNSVSSYELLDRDCGWPGSEVQEPARVALPGQEQQGHGLGTGTSSAEAGRAGTELESGSSQSPTADTEDTAEADWILGSSNYCAPAAQPSAPASPEHGHTDALTRPQQSGLRRSASSASPDPRTRSPARSSMSHAGSQHSSRRSSLCRSSAPGSARRSRHGSESGSARSSSSSSSRSSSRSHRSSQAEAQQNRARAECVDYLVGRGTEGSSNSSGSGALAARLLAAVAALEGERDALATRLLDAGSALTASENAFHSLSAQHASTRALLDQLADGALLDQLAAPTAPRHEELEAHPAPAASAEAAAVAPPTSPAAGTPTHALPSLSAAAEAAALVQEGEGSGAQGAAGAAGGAEGAARAEGAGHKDGQDAAGAPPTHAPPPAHDSTTLHEANQVTALLVLSLLGLAWLCGLLPHRSGAGTHQAPSSPQQQLSATTTPMMQDPHTASLSMAQLSSPHAPALSHAATAAVGGSAAAAPATAAGAAVSSSAAARSASGAAQSAAHSAHGGDTSAAAQPLPLAAPAAAQAQLQVLPPRASLQLSVIQDVSATQTDTPPPRHQQQQQQGSSGSRAQDATKTLAFIHSRSGGSDAEQQGSSDSSMGTLVLGATDLDFWGGDGGASSSRPHQLACRQELRGNRRACHSHSLFPFSHEQQQQQQQQQQERVAHAHWAVEVFPPFGRERLLPCWEVSAMEGTWGTWVDKTHSTSSGLTQQCGSEDHEHEGAGEEEGAVVAAAKASEQQHACADEGVGIAVPCWPHAHSVHAQRGGARHARRTHRQHTALSSGSGSRALVVSGDAARTRASSKELVSTRPSQLVSSYPVVVRTTRHAHSAHSSASRDLALALPDPSHSRHSSSSSGCKSTALVAAPETRLLPWAPTHVTGVAGVEGARACKGPHMHVTGVAGVEGARAAAAAFSDGSDDSGTYTTASTTQGSSDSKSDSSSSSSSSSGNSGKSKSGSSKSGSSKSGGKGERRCADKKGVRGKRGGEGAGKDEKGQKKGGSRSVSTQARRHGREQRGAGAVKEGGASVRARVGAKLGELKSWMGGKKDGRKGAGRKGGAAGKAEAPAKEAKKREGKKVAQAKRGKGKGKGAPKL